MYDDYDLDYTYSNEFYAYDLDEMVEHHMNDTVRDMHDSYEMLMKTVMMIMHEIHVIITTLHIGTMHDRISKHRTGISCTHTNESLV